VIVGICHVVCDQQAKIAGSFHIGVHINTSSRRKEGIYVVVKRSSQLVACLQRENIHGPGSGGVKGSRRPGRRDMTQLRHLEIKRSSIHACSRPLLSTLLERKRGASAFRCAHGIRNKLLQTRQCSLDAPSQVRMTHCMTALDRISGGSTVITNYHQTSGGFCSPRQT
jgi:hypothetical protein